MIVVLETQFDNLLSAIETLMIGTLSSYLIPSATIQKVLDHVTEQLGKSQSPY